MIDILLVSYIIYYCFYVLYIYIVCIIRSIIIKCYRLLTVAQRLHEGFAGRRESGRRMY